MPQERPDLITVVIPNFNGAATIGEQLEALSEQTYRGNWEVVISDNGSTDESAEIIGQWTEKLPDLRIVDASDRKGVSHARNIGARSARGDFIVFCDGDDIVVPGWLEAMATAAADLDVVGGFLDEETLNEEEIRDWRVSLPTDRLNRALRFLPYAPGGNCGVRTSVYQEMNGWNEGYVAGCNDIEFSWRAILAGHEVGFAEGAVIQVRYRSDLKPLGRQFYRWGREEAHLFHDYRAHGMPRTKIRKAVVEWAWLLWHVLDMYGSSSERGIWMRKASLRWGRIAGSFRYRTIYL